jgi:hypothetical protein
LTLASGATALGSVLTESLLESSTIHCVLLLLNKLNQYRIMGQFEFQDDGSESTLALGPRAPSPAMSAKREQRFVS